MKTINNSIRVILLAFLVISSTAIYSGEQQQFSKFYVSPGSIYVAPDAIYVNLDGNFITVDSLFVDEEGVYIDDVLWVCRYCGNRDNTAADRRCTACDRGR